MNFPFNFLRLSELGETLRENVVASSHTWQLKEKTQAKPIRFWRIVLLSHRSLVYTLQSTVVSFNLAHFPTPKLSVTLNRV